AAFRDRRPRVACLTLPLAGGAAYLACCQGYRPRTPLSMNEAVMWAAMFRRYGPIATMVPHLLAVGATGIVLGPFHSTAQYPDLAGIVTGLALLGLAAFAAVAGTARMHRTILAMAVLAVAPYVLVAAARANVYDLLNIGMPQAARTPRYHYVATIPLAVVLSLVLVPLVQRARAI